MRFLSTFCFAAVSIVPLSAGLAQTGEQSFDNAYAGVEAGLYDQHFYLETTSPDGASDGRYYRNWTWAGGAFAGRDFAIAPNLRLGGEIAVTLGGGTNSANLGNAGSLSYKSRSGYRAVIRGGLVVAPKLLLYVSGGYGGNRYRIANLASVGGTSEWGSSFIVGTGAEYRLSRRASVRLDVKHLDNESSQFFIGVPVRF